METLYTKSVDGTSIAYQDLRGAGPVVLSVPGAISNLMLLDLDPVAARAAERMSRFCRLLRFDKRGAGLSDRSAPLSTIDQQVADVEAVRVATGTETMVLSGLSQGAAVALLYTARYPERVSHLILNQGVCCDALNPYAEPGETRPLLEWDEFFGDLDTDFGAFSRRFCETLCPNSTPQVVETMVNFLRISASPQNLRALWQGIVGLDLRPLLQDIHVPTLVTHTSGDRHHPVAHGRYLAANIPGARLLELDSDLHVPQLDSGLSDQIVTAVEEFVTGDVQYTADRRFAAILFSDLVNSTTEQAKRGDEAWRGSIGAWEDGMRRVVAQYSGRVVKFQGDGVMAAFPSAGEALRAARGALSATKGLGLLGRAGVHAGEAYEVDGDLFGTCVNLAARVCDSAAPGEVLATPVVEGLVEGSGLVFTDRGERDLKGLGRRRLVALSGA